MEGTGNKNRIDNAVDECMFHILQPTIEMGLDSYWNSLLRLGIDLWILNESKVWQKLCHRTRCVLWGDVIDCLETLQCTCQWCSDQTKAQAEGSNVQHFDKRKRQTECNGYDEAKSHQILCRDVFRPNNAVEGDDTQQVGDCNLIQDQLQLRTIALE